MKSFVGKGKGSPAEAVEEACQGLFFPSLVVFMTAYENLGEVAKAIHEKYPDIPTMGSTGIKIANGTFDTTSVFVMAFFQDAVVRRDVIENASETPLLAMRRFESQLDGINPGESDTVCLEMCTSANISRCLVAMACFLQRYGVSLVGGAIFESLDFPPIHVALNGELYDDAMVYALIKNTTGKVKVYKNNIYLQQDNKLHFATKTKMSDMSILEFDNGLSPLEIYTSETNLDITTTKENIINNTFVAPFGRVVGDDIYIISLRDCSPPAPELACFRAVNLNDCLCVLSLGDYEKIEDELRAKIHEDIPNPSLIFSVDCIFRFMLYSQKGYFDTYVRNMNEVARNHFGFVSGGEQINDQPVNQTAVIAVFE